MLTIVFTPVYGPETQIQNHNAPLPTPPVYLIFWGSYWLQGNGPQNEQQLIYGAQQVLNSSFLQATAQYGTSGTATYGYSLTTTETGEPATGFSEDTLYQIEYRLAHSGFIPNGNSVTPVPVFAIITPPGIVSDVSNAAGYNTNLFESGDSVNYATIWASSSASTGNAINVDAFTYYFSHEMAECMTDLGRGGFELNPGPTFPNPPANSNQICDYEAQNNVYREYTGALVQSVWSRAKNAFVVTEGNAQDFILNTNASGGYDLVLNGDQLGNSDDTFYIDTISAPAGDEVKAVINSEVAVFEPNAIRSITINTDGGTNTVYVARTVAPVTIHGNPSDRVKLGVGGSVQGIKADVTVSQGERVHMIEVDDSTDPTSLHPAVGFGTVADLLSSGKLISYPFGVNGANENLTIDSGPGTSAFDVTGTIAAGSVTLNTVQGTNAVNVRYVDSGGPLTVNLGGGAQNVNISPGAKDLSTTLFADVTVNPGTGTSTLSIDDDNATAVRHWTIDDGSINSDIAGAGVIHYGRMSIVNLNGGMHGNTFIVQNTTNGLITNLSTGSGDVVNVLGTGFFSTLDLYGNASTVNVGNAGHMANVTGLVDIETFRTAVTLDDSADLAHNDVVIDDTFITGLGSDIIGYRFNAGFDSLNVKGGGGGSTYHLHGLPDIDVAHPVVLDIASGDRIEFGQNGSLAGDWENALVVCNFTGSGPASHVVMDGSLDSAPAAYTISGSNNLVVADATPGPFGSLNPTVTLSGFRSQDEALIRLQGGTVNADLTHTSPGTISLDGTVRLEGTNASAQVNVTVHARDRATSHPAGANESAIQAFNTMLLIGIRPQDSLDVFDGNNQVSISNQPIQAPYVQFASTQGDPTSVAAEDPFDFAIVAQDAQGGTLAKYGDTVQWYAYNRTTGYYFESNYESFLPADQGQHVFHGLILPEAGIYSLGFDDGWNATNFTINVVAGMPGLSGIQPDVDSSAPIIVSALSSAPPAAVSSELAAGTPPGAVPVAVCHAGNEASESTSSTGHSVPNSVIKTPLHETAQAERVLTKWALPSSGGIPTPTDDVRSLQENIVTAAVTGGSHVRSLSLISDITAAVDEWFDHFGRHDTFHSAGQGKTKTLMNWDLHDLTDQVPDGPDHERILSPLNKG